MRYSFNKTFVLYTNYIVILNTSINDIFQENKWLSIDNEDYEVKPMKLSVLSNAVYFFKPVGSTNQNQLPTKNDQGSRLSLDKFNKLGFKPLV